MKQKKIFNLDYKQIKILIHPKSYVHAIIKFCNGITKILIHDTDMSIPIYNSIYDNKKKYFKKSLLDLKTINNLNFSTIDKKKFPSINIIKSVSTNNSLYETVLVSANDILVDSFLKNINNKLKKILNLSEFKRLNKVYPKTLKQIIDTDKKVRLKTQLYI